jgi:cysteine-S-conjugate beta-lyase
MTKEATDKQTKGADPLFDDVPDRRGTHSLKWDKYGSRDILPLWVADMDFRSPPAVVAAVEDAASFGNFGYGKVSPELTELVIERMAALHEWKIDPSWIVWLPGMVCAFNLACRSCAGPDDEIISAVPVYPPFLTAPGHGGQKLVRTPLVLTNDRWTLDFDAMESIVTERSRVFLFCHPHNPVGTSFTKLELERFAEFCLRHDLVACSDEIHCDLILDEETQHIPLASLSSEIADRTITLMAPSKTFNLPGFGCSFAIISNASLRSRYKRFRAGIVPDPPAMGLALTEAAYRDGEPWRQSLLAYLRANRDIALARLQNIPGLRPFPVSATYLAWIDARGLGMEKPCQFFEEHGVGLSDGSDFGAPGYLRLNFGCSRALLLEAIDRMATAVANH